MCVSVGTGVYPFLRGRSVTRGWARAWSDQKFVKIKMKNLRQVWPNWATLVRNPFPFFLLGPSRRHVCGVGSICPATNPIQKIDPVSQRSFERHENDNWALCRFLFGLR